MSWLKNIFSSGAAQIVDSVGNTIDRLTTSDDEKSKAKQELSDLITSRLNELATLQASVLTQELKGNWLQRSWRPIVMLSFAAIVVYSKFVAPAFGLPNAELERDFWVLLEVGIGGYVIGRSVEKVAGKVTENVDMPFLKRKDRSSD